MILNGKSLDMIKDLKGIDIITTQIIESDSQLQQQQQIEFRVNRGFENLINRGIRPDINLLLETFKFTTNDLNYRLKLKV